MALLLVDAEAWMSSGVNGADSCVAFAWENCICSRLPGPEWLLGSFPMSEQETEVVS